MEFFFEILVIAFMLAFNAIFAAYEMALASVSRVKLAAFISEKRHGAEEAAYMKDRMEGSLAITQLMVTLFGAIAAATGGAGVTDSLVPFFQEQYHFSEGLAKTLSLFVLVIPLSCLTLILGELVPKVFAINNKEWVCLELSPLMKFFAWILYPLILLFENIVKKIIGIGKKHWSPPKILEEQYSLHELKAAATLAKASRLIGTREEKIVLSAAQLSVRPVKSIMLSILDISMIPVNSTLSEALVRAHMDMHTRFPVCNQEGDPQTIQGYINFKDIVLALKLNPSNPSIQGITRPLKIVNQNTPISQVLEQMIQEKLHIALVSSDTGATVGMITLEDIIEELVGEIEDEFDYLPSYIHSYGTGWVMGGGVPMNVVCQTAGVIWNQSGHEIHTPTLAEWCDHRLGRTPKGGEVIEGNGLTVLVRKLRRKKLAEAIVNVLKD